VAYPGVFFVSNSTGTVPPGFARYSAIVTEAGTGRPVVGACVYTGPPAGCPRAGANTTDTSGYFATDLPSVATFSFTIEHPLYNAIIQRALVAGTTASLTTMHK
jgi:hypothetical protein